MRAANPTVLDVLGSMVRAPYHHLIERWNWKSALTSAIIRGAIFFSANLSVGMRAAVGAMVVDWSFRALLCGVTGSITQSLRKAEPAWAATLTAIVVLPAFSHAIEFLVHWVHGTPKLATSIIASVAFTILSTLFNLYAMRQGVLLVHQGGKSLTYDFIMMPRVVLGFVAFGPLLLWRAAQRRSVPVRLFD
jgi:hypothetical protein